MKFTKINIVFLIFLAGVIGIAGFAAGFGASSDYWDENPLKLEAGSTQEIELRLQNLVGDSSVILRANIQEGKEIASLVDENTDYIVPLGNENVPVKILVKVPENAESGKVYNLLIAFDQLASPDDSFLQLAGAIKKRIPVEVISAGVVESEEIQSPSSDGSLTMIIVLVVLIIVITAFIYMVKRQKNSLGTEEKKKSLKAEKTNKNPNKQF